MFKQDTRHKNTATLKSLCLTEVTIVYSAMEVEPGDTGQHNEDVTDVNPGTVGKQEPHTAAASRH